MGESEIETLFLIVLLDGHSVYRCDLYDDDDDDSTTDVASTLADVAPCLTGLWGRFIEVALESCNVM